MPHPLPSAANRLPIRILDETEDWIVVDKPAHVLVHPSKPGGPFTLWDGLRELLAYEIVNGGQVSIINRLDRETSGVSLICKSSKAARDFSQRMERREITKEYLAIVWGWPERDHYEIEVALARQGDFRESRIHLKQAVVENGGTQARTRISVERRFEKQTTNGNRFSIVRAFPETGRMHQIRVHLAHLGFPIVGDKIYGPDEENYLEFIETGWTPRLAASLLLDRHALHSTRLRVESIGLDWQSGFPADLAEWLPR